jgi:hypothetical protein
MTITTDTYQTYQAVGNREDLTNDIINISPTETPFISMIAKNGTAKATYHEWQTQALAGASSTNYQVEGDNIDNTAATPTVRVGNRTQISSKVFQVSGTQRAVNPAGRSDELAYQRMMKAKELKRDMETSATGNVASVTGDASTARRCGGLETTYTSNVSRGSGGSNGGFTAGNTVAATDGTQRAFTEAQLKTVLKSIYDNGGKPKWLMLGSFNKQAFSGFSGIANPYKDVMDKKIMGTATVYESDFGTITAVPNLFSRSRTAHVLDGSGNLKIAYLRPINLVKLAKTGDADREAYFTEFTLNYGNQAANGCVSDLTTS